MLDSAYKSPLTSGIQISSKDVRCLWACLVYMSGAYGEVLGLPYLADFSNLPLVSACYDHHCIARLDMHRYPHRLSILVELI